MRTSVLLTSSVLALGAVFVATAARAQDAPIPTVVVETDGHAAPVHRFGDAVDSGTTIIDRDSVETRAPGSGDVNEILRALPAVQFSSVQGRADRDSLQDLRPENLSISGGSIYENQFKIDGVGVNSRLDVSGTNPQHFIEGNAAASAQTVWVDSSLVESLTLRDSNVSARYSQFTGGVLEITTRSPGRVFGVETYYGETSTGLAEFVVRDATEDALNGVLPQEPDYEKRRYGVTIDMPYGDRIRTVVAYNLQESTVTNYRGANWLKYGDYGLSSRNETVLLKVDADLPSDLLLTSQFLWSPYESRFSHPNGIENYTTLNGGGFTGKLGLEGSLGEGDWTLELSHAFSNNDRDSDHPGTVNVSTSGGSGIDWCSGTSCSLGGPGILNQSQDETALEGDWEQPLGGGILSAGFRFARIEGEKGQPYSAAFRHVGTTAYPTVPNEVNPNTVCADPAEAEAGTCVTGRYALAQRNDTTAFHTNVNLTSAGVWVEYETDLSGFLVRVGLRYDYENFLGNHDFAPRLSVSRDLPSGLNLTLGANRYYGRSFLGYALRENYPGNRIYQRRPAIVGTQRIWSNNWNLSSHSETARYSNVGLSTPYSDELTAVLRGSIPYIGGEFRLKAVRRDGENEFSSSRATTEAYSRETGGTFTRQVYTITSDGSRRYKGLTFEYVRQLGANHALTLSASDSHSSSTNISYFDLADETEFESALVYFRGEILPHLQVTANNQLEDHASPATAYVDWAATWLGGRLRTNVNVYWRDGFERIEDTGANVTVGATRYDVFDTVEYGSAVSSNLSASFELARTSWGTALLDVRVENLFNRVMDTDYTSTSQPYQLGRNVWVALKYRY